MAQNLGTIPSVAVFGYEKQPGLNPAPAPSAAASGVKPADSSAAWWYAALVGVLVLVRIAWEYAD